MKSFLPCLNFCWSSNGSRAASSDSKIFSNNTHRPNRTPFSRVRKKFLSLIFITSISFVQKEESFPIFLIYRFAWPWGSINNGYLRPWAIIIPFSTEWESLGKPNIVHCLIATGSDKVDRRLHPVECGISSTTNWVCQLLTIFKRKSGVNTPR